MATFEDTAYSLAEDDNFMVRFCLGCPETRHFPATLDEPACDYCPAEYMPWDSGCIRHSDFETIFETCKALDKLVKEI